MIEHGQVTSSQCQQLLNLFPNRQLFASVKIQNQIILKTGGQWLQHDPGYDKLLKEIFEPILNTGFRTLAVEWHVAKTAHQNQKFHTDNDEAINNIDNVKTCVIYFTNNPESPLVIKTDNDVEKIYPRRGHFVVFPSTFEHCVEISQEALRISLVVILELADTETK